MDTQKQTVSVFWTERFYSRLNELNRRAVKLGLPEVKATVLGKQRRYAGENVFMEAYYVEEFEIELEYVVLKLAGWHLVGVIDHRENIVKTAPGQQMPAQYLGAREWCDHCKMHRDRIETFIVQHESGEYKQVGRQCVADFLGTDPSWALGGFDFTILVGALAEDDDEDVFDGRFTPGGYNLTAFLAYTALSIRTRGWVSRSDAESLGKAATADVVLTHIDQLALGYRVERATPADYELAEAVVAWMKALEPCGNEYLYNLLTIGENGYTTTKTAGFAASAVRAYQREQEQKAAAQSKRYVAEVGTKVDIEVVYINTLTFAGAYGPSNKHFFVTDEGLMVVWSTAKDAPAPGRYKLVGKVNKHHEYRGNLQTGITNPKLQAVAAS